MAATVLDTSKSTRRSWPRRVLFMVGPAAICCLGVIVLLLALENKLIFHPVSFAEDWIQPASVGLHAEDLQLTSADGTAIHAWWCPHPSNRVAGKTLLYCHGNAGNLSHRATAILELQQHLGMSVLIFDYPGYGQSQGKPTEHGCCASAAAAHRWLVQKKSIPPEEIVIYGDSLGGGVAVEMARQTPYRALILARTFTSIPAVAQSIYPWIPVQWLMRNRFNSVEKLASCDGPIFIAHGDQDHTIPFIHGKELFDRAKEPKAFLVMRNCDHNDPLPAAFFDSVATFLASNPPRQANERMAK